MRALLLVLIILSFNVYAGGTGTSGALTFLNLNQKISPYSSLTYYHYDIFNFARKKFKNKEFRPGDNQTYFQFAYNYQWSPDLSLTAGYIYQRSMPFETDHFQNENRIFEQVVFANRFRSFKNTHRFRFEQRFIDSRSPDVTYMRTRLRYQIGAKIPLRGLSLDAGEYFINTYNEVYFSTTGERNAFLSDDWLYFGLGKRLKELGSFELGPVLQYSVINKDKDWRIHYVLMAGWSYSF